ncbi:universal stress protein [Amycolatopsis sp. NPDC059657]|uniref:universal stress protein n=1 Tax=Amycolatopsis sp. NPDC059657 TaxID=3346899 RepID=UPI00366DA48E
MAADNDSTFTHPIVVGVDGSASSLHAACWAADEAAWRKAPLRLVHAVSRPALAYGGGAGLPDEFSAALEADGRQYLADACALVLTLHPELPVEIDLAAGEAVASLLELSHSAQLMVLGSSGQGGFTGLLTGSTAVALVARGHCPVAVIRGRQASEKPPSSGPVVVGVDGSEISDVAIATAFEEAASRGVGLVAVHAWIGFNSDSAYSHARQLFTSLDVLEAREREWLDERLASGKAKYPGVTVETVLARDRAVRCLLDHSAGGQLLVIGSRGRGGLSGMVLGSTSQALIYHATCPLLVVRPA